MSTALATLIEDYSAHLVLVGKAKRPIWKRWNKRRPGVEVVEHHASTGRHVGIIPASIHTSALDCDKGETEAFISEHIPLAVLPSRRRSGRHLYYDDTEPRGNAQFKLPGFEGMAGDVRSGRGYLVMHHNGAEILADALATKTRSDYPFPAGLFERVPTIRPFEVQRPGKVLPFPRSARPDTRLEDVAEGRRHYALFDTVRFWAYDQDKGDDIEKWCRRVDVFAISQNQRFPVPQPYQEVFRMAYAVATWVWDGGGPLDHSTATQRRRALKLGRMRRAATKDRDMLIQAASEAGMLQREIGERYGLSQPAVSKILRRSISGPNDPGGRFEGDNITEPNNSPGASVPLFPSLGSFPKSPS